MDEYDICFYSFAEDAFDEVEHIDGIEFYSFAEDTFDEEDVDDMDFDDDGWDLEVGYDPYMGCYSDDC